MTTLRVTRCRVACGLADFLLPGRPSESGRTVLLDNETGEPVKVERMTIELRSGESGDAAGKGFTMKVPSEPFAADSIVPVAATVDRNKLSAGLYTGTLILGVDRRDDVARIPVQLLVRDGPLPVILFLVIGLLVGRVARQQETPQAALQLALYPRIVSLRTRAKEVITDGPAQAFALRLIDGLDRRVERAGEPQDALAKAVDDAEEAVQFLADVDTIEANVGALPENKREEVERLLGEARTALMAGNRTAAEQKRQEVEALIQRLERDKPMGAEGEPILATIRRPRPSVVETGEAADSAQQAARKPTRIETAAAFLTGTQASKARVRYWIIRPFLALALLITLLLLGLQYLWVDNRTFGGDGIVDYVGVLLWGLTAEVATAGLLKLPGRPRGGGGGGGGQVGGAGGQTGGNQTPAPAAK